MTSEALRLWVTMRAPESRWRRAARETIRLVVVAHPELLDDNAALLKAVDAAYPFGERAMLPYKMWLLERKAFRAAMSVPAAPSRDEAEVCSVARDELELHPERAEEIRRMLDEQAPNRLGSRCPACAAKIGEACIALVGTPVDHCIYERCAYRLIVPHEARLVGHLGAGPLFRGAVMKRRRTRTQREALRCFKLLEVRFGYYVVGLWNFRCRVTFL